MICEAHHVLSQTGVEFSMKTNFSARNLEISSLTLSMTELNSPEFPPRCNITNIVKDEVRINSPTVEGK